MNIPNELLSNATVSMAERETILLPVSAGKDLVGDSREELYGEVGLLSQTLRGVKNGEELNKGMLVWQQSFTEKGTPRFRVTDILGEGGQGTVYQVYDYDFKRDVAFKVLKHTTPAPQHITRFIHEAQVTAQLEHPGIVPVHDVNVMADGTVYYTMKKVSGLSLSQVIAERGGKPEHQRLLLRQFVRLCEPIAFAHSRGVIHRDLKPSNVMTGDYGEIIVLDWGLAKILGQADVCSLRSESPAGDRRQNNQVVSGAHSVIHTGDGRSVGTPGYMSPEQAQGNSENAGVTSDIFALGVILYELLSGCKPWSSQETGAIMEEVRGGTFVPITERTKNLLPHITAVVHKAMAAESDNRYQSVNELITDINNYLNNDSVSVYTETFMESCARLCSRHKIAIRSGLLVAGIALCCAVGLFFLNQVDRKNERKRLYTQAAVLMEQEQWDRARSSLEQALALFPLDETLLKGLFYVKQREAAANQENIHQQDIEQAQQKIATVHKALMSPETLVLANVFTLLSQADERLAASDKGLRAEVVVLRDKAKEIERQQLVEQRMKVALQDLQEAETLVARGEWKNAELLCLKAAEIIPNHKHLQAVQVQVTKGLAQLQIEENRRQGNELLKQALGEQQAGNSTDALYSIEAALKVVPQKYNDTQLQHLFDVRDTIVKQQREEETSLHNQTVLESVRRLRKLCADGQAEEARGILERIRTEAFLSEQIRDLDQVVARAEQEQRNQHALVYIAQSSACIDKGKACLLSVQELSARIHQLHSAGAYDQAFPLEQLERDLKKEMSQEFEKAAGLLYEARTLASEHPQVRRAIAGYYALQVEMSYRRGDLIAAATQAVVGKRHDKENTYRLLFSGLCSVMNAGEADIILSPLIEQQHRRLETDQKKDQTIPAGTSKELPYGRYLVHCNGRDIQALWLRGGEKTSLQVPMDLPDLPADVCYIPSGLAVTVSGEERAVEAFALAKYEVSCSEYLEFLNKSRYKDAYPRNALDNTALWKQRSNGKFVLPSQQLAAAPVSGISYQAAHLYCQWLSQQTNQHWRLPTREEWCLAAQGGDRRQYPWGDYPELNLCYSGVSNTAGDLIPKIAVGSFPEDSTIHGVMDMAGSVSEFVTGRWPEQANLHLYCGGNLSDIETARFTTTSTRGIQGSYPSIGFRVLLDLTK